MKAKDIRTIQSLINEYGMTSGVSTPVGQQQSGASAKASAANRTSKSTINAPSQSPTTQKTSSTVKEPAQPVVAKAKELKKDFEFPDEKGNVVKVVSPIGQGKNKDAVVVQNQKNKEFYTLQPDDDIALPQVDQEQISEEDLVSKIAKRKHKLHRKIKKLLRAQKHAQQGEPIFEINFNRKDIAQAALNAPIKCGFEAETTWPYVEAADDDGDWLEGKTWGEIADLIYDQEGQRSIDRIEEAYRKWLMESEYFYNAESDVIQELVVDRKEDEYYLNDYVRGNIDESDIEDYRDDKLADLESAKDEGDEDAAAEFEEREDWDIDAWGREYVEENDEGAFEEWLADQIRENGEQWDDAWERAMEAADMDRYMEDEHGSWYDLLRSEDIYLVNDESGGLEEVANRIEGWANNNSMSNDVRPGDYHSGSGVDNTYWRVESDSSIEGEGTGAEIISPVYDSPAEMLKEMKSLFEFLESESVVTNDSTGLHITMSWTQQDDTPVNKLKMALLLGDKYVAKQFDRERNNYTKSQMRNIQRYVNDVKNNIKDEKSLKALEEIISGGISDGKFSSINFKSSENEYGNDLIEFRVAGGYDYHNKIDTIAKTVVRYSAVMQAGHDPDAFRKDYVKALFRLISGQDDITTDDQRKAQQMINPDTINTRVLDAFQKLAGKKHYTDAIEQLGNAYAVLADVRKLKSKNPQKELDLGEDIDDPDYNAADDWREVLKTAQHYFIRAFTLLAIDVAAGANRAQPKAANIAALRGAIKEFGLDINTIWDQMQKSEYLKRLSSNRQSLAGSHYDKLERLAAAVNTLLKQQAVKAPDAAFELTIPEDHLLLMPKEKHTAAFGDLFGRTQPDPNATVSKDDFITVDEDLYRKVQRARHQVQDSTRYVEAELERLEKYKQELKAEKKAQNLVRANKIVDAIETTKVSISRYKEDAEYNQQIIDEFFKKYGFVPKGRRSDLEAIGPEYQIVRSDEIAALGPRFNIKVKTNGMSESVFDRFDKLPLTEQLKIIEKVDSNKLNEAWSKKYKDSINCSDPKGFSQKAHCAGKKKKTEATGVDHIKKSLVVATEMDTEWRGNKHRAVDMGKKVLGKYPAKMIKFSRSEYSLFVLDDENKPMMYFQLKNVGAGYIVSVSQLRKKYQGSGLGQKIYTSLVKDLGLTLVSDITQSPGARKVWFNLANTPGVFVYAWNKNAKDPDEKFQQVTATELGELETATGFAYDSEKGKNSVAGDRWQAIRKAKRDGASRAEIAKISKEYDDEIGAMKKAKPVRLVATPQKGLKKPVAEYKISEGAVPDNSSDRKIKQLLNQPLLANDLKAQMEAYFVIPDPSMIRAFREARTAGGDQTDLRPIFRGFIDRMAHPQLKKKAGLKESVIKEDDRDQERFNFIIDKLKQHPEFIKRVYRFIKTDAKNSERVHPQDFLTPDRTGKEQDYNYKGVLPEFVRAIMNTDGDFDDIENFLATYGKVSYVNTKALMKDGATTWDKWLRGSKNVSVQFITELYDNLFNVALNIEGSNRGPGEVGLALLSPNITFASVGDLKINGEEVEVKGEKSSGGGRLKNSNADYGQPNLDAVYDKFNITPEDRPQRLPSANAGSRPGTHFLDIATQLDQLAPGAGKAYVKELFTATFKYGDKSMINYMIKNYARMDRAAASELAGEISYSSYANILKGKGFSKFLFLKAPGKKSLAFDVDDYKNHLDKFKLGSLDWGDKMNGPAVQVSMR